MVRAPNKISQKMRHPQQFFKNIRKSGTSKSNMQIQRTSPVSRPPISLQEPFIIITGRMTIHSLASSRERSPSRLIISKVRRNEKVNPSLLCPIHLRVASSVSGRTYSLIVYICSNINKFRLYTIKNPDGDSLFFSTGQAHAARGASPF
jgi:hypothetical protein